MFNKKDIIDNLKSDKLDYNLIKLYIESNISKSTKEEFDKVSEFSKVDIYGLFLDTLIELDKINNFNHHVSVNTYNLDSNVSVVIHSICYQLSKQGNLMLVLNCSGLCQLAQGKIIDLKGGVAKVYILSRKIDEYKDFLNQLLKGEYDSIDDYKYSQNSLIEFLPAKIIKGYMLVRENNFYLIKSKQ
jgi:hypothetical protein